jgi:signal transduction histidine kinase
VVPAGYRTSHIHAERTIAAARVALAMASLLAVGMDPPEPARFAPLTYTLYWLYLGYAVALAGFTWTRPRLAAPVALTTHTIDIVAFSAFQYLTLGPSSPFFVYFIFSLFSGAIRWGWRGTFLTGAVVVAAFLTMAVSMGRTLGGTEFELNRFIIRVMYLCVAASLLVYLGRHEERLRVEIERLARWPAVVGADPGEAGGALIEHAAGILRASRVAVLWEARDEPWVNVVTWSAEAGAQASRHAPQDRGDPLAALSDSHARTAPFQAGQISGRVTFIPLGTPTEETTPLAEVVAREIGASLDQIHLAQRLREVAASEERIRVARDLHDGVLQSLTGIRLELRALAGSLQDDEDRARERLVALERALSIEQRELRTFIADLRPRAAAHHDGSLADRLHALGERIVLEWKTPVTMSVTPEHLQLPSPVGQAVPLMVHEAVVNALKHAHPSHVTVDVATMDGSLRIVVRDDGSGFPFKGHYDHAALAGIAGRPRSLFDRVTALGGQMTIDSAATGSTVEMALFL